METLLHLPFGQLGPPRVGNREIRGFQAILAQDGLWHLEKSRARAENGKMQFPGARGLEKSRAGPKTEKCNFPVQGALWGGKSGRPKSFSPRVRNFFTLHILADRTPTGGKSQNTGVSGHFGLGRHI